MKPFQFYTLKRFYKEFGTEYEEVVKKYLKKFGSRKKLLEAMDELVLKDDWTKIERGLPCLGSKEWSILSGIAWGIPNVFFAPPKK